MDDKIVDFCNKLNEKSYLYKVNVPIADGFKVVPNKDTLFTAVNDAGYIEQFLFDSIIGEQETFDSHLENVILKTKSSMKASSLDDVDKCFNFYNNYTNGIYDFKIYIQDNILDDRIIRQINAYFMDTDTRAFYEIAFSSCPYSIKDMNFINTELVSNMMMTVLDVLKNVK